MTGLSVGTLYHWVCQRRIPFMKIGRLTKFDVEAINKWLEKKAVACKDFS